MKPGRRPRFPDDQVRAMHVKYMAGASSVDLGREYGSPAPTILSGFHRLGLEVKTMSEGKIGRPGRPRKYSAEMVAEWAERNQCGETLVEIAESEGILRSTMWLRMVADGYVPIRWGRMREARS